MVYVAFIEPKRLTQVGLTLKRDNKNVDKFQ